eukprot:GHVP01029549.1.p1 GENE.GHVP01029549.1~~GHVP01029549.1.p1  ORF type:complete len:549 (-),score=111.82 GHVP01029549.1:192-1838(-)
MDDNTPDTNTNETNYVAMGEFLEGRSTRYGNTGIKDNTKVPVYKENPITELTPKIREMPIEEKKIPEIVEIKVEKEIKKHKDLSDEPLATSPNGRYVKFNKLLGKGAFKTVWYAVDKETGLEVAWNCLPLSRNEYNNMSNEIEILKHVRHKNIIHLHDSWFQENEFVFITEMMTSGTLREYMGKVGIPGIPVLRKWLSQILDGLIHLHENDPTIIHRDLKCDNIFINGTTGEVKIGDMGTAKMKAGKKYTVVGTPEFMAPEMYEEKGYGEKVDIYAFGMCILELLTNEYPYHECLNAAQVYKKVSAGLKPDNLAKITDPEALSLINFCITNEEDRLSARQLLQHQFFFEDVTLSVLSRNEDHSVITFKMAFKGQAKNSVKFNFNRQSDTPEQVVGEMITESVLASRFKNAIVKDIKRLLDTPVTEDELRKSDDSMRHLELDNTLQIDSSSSLQDRNDFGENLLKKVYVDFSTNGDAYTDDRRIEELVMEAALYTNRTVEKANEWIEVLKGQDIMTVGDLRGLHDEDWKHLKLSVFAMRALKNALMSSF